MPLDFEANPKTVVHPKTGKPMRLGKRPKKDDARNLRLASYVDTATVLPLRPVHAFYGYKVSTWPMYGNDSYGDCTCAAVGHSEQCWSANIGHPETPTLKSVMDLYWATGDQDDGRYEIDVLNYWRNTGFGSDSEKIIAYAEVDVSDIEMVKTAIWLFGGIYIGIALPITAQSDTDRWIYHASASDSEKEPGSWGGHAVNVVAYSDYNLWLITWGEKIKMSWAFWKHYVDEAYAIISPDWIDPLTHLAPSGFNLDGLKADLSQI